MWVIEVTLNSAITLIVLTILSILFQMIILAGEREKQMIYAHTWKNRNKHFDATLHFSCLARLYCYFY